MPYKDRRGIPRTFDTGMTKEALQGENFLVQLDGNIRHQKKMR